MCHCDMNGYFIYHISIFFIWVQFGTTKYAAHGSSPAFTSSSSPPSSSGISSRNLNCFPWGKRPVRPPAESIDWCQPILGNFHVAGSSLKRTQFFVTILVKLHCYRLFTICAKCNKIEFKFTIDIIDYYQIVNRLGAQSFTFAFMWQVP